MLEIGLFYAWVVIHDDDEASARLCVFIYVCFSENRIIIFAYVSYGMISDVFCK